jgi:hypothetical protein
MMEIAIPSLANSQVVTEGVWSSSERAYLLNFSTTTKITVFLNQFRVIQDLRSGKMIGKGIEREGLFYLNQAKKTTRNPFSDF